VEVALIDYKEGRKPLNLERLMLQLLLLLVLLLFVVVADLKELMVAVAVSEVKSDSLKRLKRHS
jgi:hypothetical protein